MLSHRFIRFLIVGGSNAVLHFTVLNASYELLGTSKIASSILATLFAMSYSFLVNKNFVFRSKAAIRNEVFAFVAVTASGVLLVHNLIYATIVYILDHNSQFVNWLYTLLQGKINNEFIIINLSTVVGALFALVWNYYGYKRFVFTTDEVKDEFENQTT